MTSKLVLLCRWYHVKAFSRRCRSYPDFRKVACLLCGKKVHELKKHMLTHTDQRPYSCENCQKGFTSRYALKIHKRQHTNERPYICSHCAMDFLRKYLC
ncbi:hypothetical protein HUJ04_009689 [Dendroctonus ponderosae]|nr:hypothetical protein HUJ04_009689 [Dendroctonus ponderosae]